MKLYSQEEMLNEMVGAQGSPAREEYDAQMETFLIGEAIRQARLSKNLTQEQLGEMLGVKKAQICKIENGGNVTFRTISRVFQAMGINAHLDLAGIGQVRLW
ncbi:MAG: helix-turn-helix domain-containing protein [Bacteroidales bacterium]|nr:helix-turn-helix domain-containing protein [Bacteroidales bacterium]